VLGWVLIAVGCSGGDFDVATEGADTNPVVDSASTETVTDGPAPDSGDIDSGRDTSEPIDTEPFDSGTTDSGKLDSGFVDVSPLDTGKLDTGTDTSVVDTGTDTGIDTGVDTGIDTGVDTGVDTGIDSSVSDSGGSDIGSVCGSVTATTTEIYVDLTATKASAGTLACPFHTIREATLLGNATTGVRTIHVAGGTYTESGLLDVASRVVLLGDGAVPTITGAAGTCPSSGYSGTICVEAGGTVDNFEVKASTVNGVVTLYGTGKATLRNLVVTGSAGNGIQVMGSAIIGPSVQADSNKSNGLLIYGSDPVEISGKGDTFDNNTVHGIYVLGTLASLDFRGGSASNNGIDGVFLAGYSPITAPFPISGLVAKGNQIGLLVNDSTSVTLRSSTLIGNKNFGLKVNFGYTSPSSPKNTIDIGASGAGGNIFGTNDSTTRNGLASMCLVQTLGTGSITASGDKWAACSPTLQLSVTGCDTSSGTTYSDVWYVKYSSGGGTDPVNVTSCSVGP